METARRDAGGWQAVWPLPTHLPPSVQVLHGARPLREAHGQWEPRACLSQPSRRPK